MAASSKTAASDAHVLEFTPLCSLSPHQLRAGLMTNMAE